jgi:PAS domain S-box-containing protein
LSYLGFGPILVEKCAWRRGYSREIRPANPASAKIRLPLSPVAVRSMEMRKIGISRYIVALLATASAVAVDIFVARILGDASLYHTLWAVTAAVGFSAWCCGLAPSILTAILGILGAWFLVLAPHNVRLTPSRADIFDFSAFLLVSGFVIALCEANRRSQFARLHQAHVLDAANDAIIELNPGDDTIRYWNQGAEKLYGWTSAEAIGKDINSLLKTVSDQPLDQSKAELMEQGNWDGEVIHTRRDGVQLYIASRSTLRRETKRRPAIWLEVNRDITERKKAEQELRKAEEQRRLAHELAYSELEKQVQDRTAELQQSNQQLRQLSASLIRSQDDERRRIARELHDSAGQYLGAVSIALEVARQEQEAAMSKLAEAGEMAKGCSAEIRTISHLLHPPLLEELGLASAAQWYVQGFAARSRIQVEMDIPKHLDRLGDSVELVLFRILQEALTNIHRHSGSKTASVRIGADSQQAWLDVQDQGKGSANGDGAGEFRPGIGITGMRERVKDLSGTLEIRSDQNGTHVKAVLPLAADRRPADADLKASSAAG